MHILQITPQLPYPPDSGGRVALFDELQYLSRRHRITLLSFATEETARHVDALSRYCAAVEVVMHHAAASRRAMAANLVSRHPYAVARFRSPAMAEKARALAVSGEIDLVQIDHLQMAQYASAVPRRVPVVLREHNVESVILRRFAARASNPFIRAYATLQARRLHRYEAACCPRFDCCVAVTEVDGRTLRRMAPAARVEVVPDGVDTERFDPSLFPDAPEATRLVTTGDYGWPPTADGLAFLVHRIFPRIRKAVPEARLSVVGRCPPASIVRMGEDAGIDILGRVEDVRPEMLRGAVFAAPTRVGSGIRLKILEAMALRRPVVSTPVGCEGIEATPEEHILVADDPEGFASRVVHLFQNPALRTRLTAAAAERIAQRYAWSILVERLDAVYQRVLHDRPAPDGRPAPPDPSL